MEKISSWPKSNLSEEKKHKLRKQREQDHKNRDLWKFMTNVMMRDVFTGESPMDKEVDNNRYISNAQQLIQESDNIQREAATLVEQMTEDDLYKNLIVNPKKHTDFVEQNQIELRQDNTTREKFRKIEGAIAGYNNRIRAVMARQEKDINVEEYNIDINKSVKYQRILSNIINEAEVFLYGDQDKQKGLDKKLLQILKRRGQQYQLFEKLKQEALVPCELQVNQSNIENISKYLIKDLYQYQDKFFGKQNKKLSSFKNRSKQRISFYLGKVLGYVNENKILASKNPQLKEVIMNMALFKEMGFEIDYQGNSLYNVRTDEKKELYEPFLTSEERDKIELSKYLTTVQNNSYKETAQAEDIKRIKTRAVVRGIKPPTKSGDLDQYNSIIKNYVRVDQEFADRDVNSYYGYKYTGFESITKNQFQNVKKGTVFSLPTKYLANDESAQIVRKMLMQMNIGSKYVVAQHKKSKTFWVLPANDPRVARLNPKDR